MREAEACQNPLADARQAVDVRAVGVRDVDATAAAVDEGDAPT